MGPRFRGDDGGRSAHGVEPPAACRSGAPRYNAAMIVNIAAYHFVHIDDPGRVVGWVRAAAETHGLLGTALVAPEGLNLFLAGDGDAIDAFLADVRTDPRFAGLREKRSLSRHVPFARLKVKRKREIISFRRDRSDPLQGRAPSVSPDVLAQWLQAGHDDAGRPLVLLDTRNREEVAYGTFRDAMVLPIDNFTDLPAAVLARREALQGARVVSFCTGGIRCEKAALWMQAEGFDTVVQLDGGILGYFERMGGAGYEGGCFVFDERVALDPSLAPLHDAPVPPPPPSAIPPRTGATPHG